MSGKPKKALLIGINYINSSLRLYGCINDAVAVKSVLVDAYGYREQDVIVMRDDSYFEGIEGYENRLPTKENIMAWLNSIADESENLEELWIHYSGHGSYIGDSSINLVDASNNIGGKNVGNVFNGSNDETDGNDEVIIPYDYIYDSTKIIVDDELRTVLNNIKCKTYITMDCCHAGTSWDLPYKYTIQDNMVIRNIENSYDLSNTEIYMLSGSRDNQVSIDYYNFEERVSAGIFTMVLIQSMRDLNHNYTFLNLYKRINDYFEYIDSTFEYGLEQRCLLSSSSILPFISINRKNGLINEEVPRDFGDNNITIKRIMLELNKSRNRDGDR